MTINYWNNVDEQTWWQIAKECEYATFYHTPAWHNLFKEINPGSHIKTIGGTLENGTQFVLPIITVKRMGPFNGLVSAAGNVYGGIIADGPLSDTKTKDIYQSVTRKWKTLYFRFLPSPLLSPLHLDSVEDLEKYDDKAVVIDLSTGFESIYNNYSRGHKSALKKAEKSGAIIQETLSLEDYQEYFQVYQDSIERWGETTMAVLPWHALENIYNLAQKMPENIKLWVAKVDGKIASGALIAYWNQTIMYYHGANHRDFFQHRIANLLQSEIIRDASQSGSKYRYYDFGPSGISDGVFEFKRRFGGDVIPVNWWVYTDPKLSTVQKVTSSFKPN